MKKFVSCVLALAVMLSSASAEIYAEPPRDNWYQSPLLRVTAFNFAQSDCLLVECGGESMLIDGGTGAFSQELVSRMEGRSFLYILNTHFHEDHIAGLIALLENGSEVGEYLHPYPDNAIYLSPLHRRAVQAAARSRQIADGEVLMMGEAVIRLMRYEEGKSTNGRSVVVRIDFGEASILLPADIIGDTQTWLCENRAEYMDVDILKAPHHAVSIMTPAFLKMTSPEAVFVTNNRVKAAEGKRQLEQENRKTYYTEDGSIILETDGEDWVIYHLEKAENP